MASAKRKSASRDRAVHEEERSKVDRALAASIDPTGGSHFIRVKYEVLLYFEDLQQGIDPHGPLCRPIAIVHYGLQKVVPKGLHKSIKVIDGRFEAGLFRPKVKKPKAVKKKAKAPARERIDMKSQVCRDPMCPRCERQGH